ncbi:single-stranded DNA-binding protein [Gloeobacter morelensis]|uniref:Single-stranded DNA-binding protein n=1 Tax=Gloeobacter morelensis MG652769 TaxID=2781736 RepID=A0ABY3PRE0_9CYAN|nr:single-stranded DNA-binding protein [Gloeobacter morelensis]UFP96263.1 single-stranded DNA-binding protein [Gloeobacter morelensis MG652769]
MNTIALLGTLHSAPQLRHTQDGLAQASVVLSFTTLKADEADYTVRVVLFAAAAEEFHANFHQGDAVIVEGRLHSESRTREDGTKERHVEVIARRVHAVAIPAAPATPAPAPVPPATTKQRPPAAERKTAAPTARRPAPSARSPVAAAVADDDIPF